MNNKEIINLLKEERNALDLQRHNIKETNRRLNLQIQRLTDDINRMSPDVKKRFAPRLRRQIKISRENIDNNNYYLLRTWSEKNIRWENKCTDNGICWFKLTQLIEEERGWGIYI